MKAEQFEAYTKERNAIIKEYRKKKLKTCLPILAVGIALIAIIFFVGGFALENIPVTAVLILITGIFTIIYLRVKFVIINHALQKKLHQFEDQSLLKY